MFDHGADGHRPDGTVLGIDPGLSRCGYGAVRREAGGARAVAYGVLRTPAGDGLPERLAALQGDLESLLDEIRPASVAVERVLFQNNVRTAISVGQASGLALATAACRGVPVVCYSPNEVKLAVAGHGAADKRQVQDMVARMLGLEEPPRPPDAADALALALAHLWGARMRSLVPSAATSTSSSTSRGASRLDAAIRRAVERDNGTGGAPSSGARSTAGGAGGPA
ncbi:MAG: crossover junction endodeoxyribonuclease RuvC [Acidimicrobiia bacterium]